MHPVGIVFIILILLLLLAYTTLVLLSFRRARSLGLPNPSLNPIALIKNRNAGGPSYPAPRSGGLVGWLHDKINAFKYRRSATGSYEATGLSGQGGAGGQSGTRARGGAPLDPDEAWDSRVGQEAYYEEQELGLHGTSATPYGGSGYGPAGSGATEYFAGEDRGRSRTRELDERYDEEMGRGAGARDSQNPFGDHAEPSRLSLRPVSPRPHDEQGKKEKDSPTERRSLFREDV